jgi:hypothetical protein
MHRPSLRNLVSTFSPTVRAARPHLTVFGESQQVWDTRRWTLVNVALEFMDILWKNAATEETQQNPYVSEERYQ